MNVSSSSSYNTGTNYTIKLNDKEMLLVEEDPLSKAQYEARKADKEKALETQKEQNKTNNSPENLSQDEKRVVKELGVRDSEVKSHEAAHQAAGGGMTGAASYTYQQGPDGKMYAIGGEVSISAPSGSTPEETIKNARQIAAAAMAAGDPSPQDFSVASSAKVMEMKAIQQKAKEVQEKMDGQNSYQNASTPKEQESRPTMDISA